MKLLPICLTEGLYQQEMDWCWVWLMKMFAGGAVGTSTPEQSGAPAQARPRPLPVLLPWQPPQPAFPWLLTHELNVRLMQMYSSHFCLGCIC